MSRSADLYERLPPSGRMAAASIRGLQLRATRYDRQLESRVEAALERERWSTARWDREISQSLSKIIDAARTTPYYRQRLAGSATDLDGLPITLKSDVRGDPGAFHVSNPGTKVVVDRTSGTSGTPLELLYDREAVRTWFAITEARIKRWHGVSSNDRWAMFGGQMVVPIRRTEPPFWVHNRPMRQLYVSTHHLSRRNAPAVAAALCKFGPRYLLGYPSSMALLARYALDDSLRLPEVKVVLSNAETLTSAQREVLSTAFSAPVRDTYGMAEAVAGASECEHGSMHLWPEVGIVEVLDEAGTATSDEGAHGRLVATGLLNRAMPLLRYEIGDLGSAPTPSSCDCGRTLPVLGDIQGRSSDFIVTPDGRHVFWMNPVLTGLPVAEAQFIQHAVDRIEVVVVPSGGWSEAFSQEVIHRCRKRLGDDVTVEPRVVDAIERDPSGKFRPVVSTVQQT